MVVTGSLGIGPRLVSLGSKTVVADGSEQTLTEQPGGRTSSISGYIDMRNMVGGDSVIIREYVKVSHVGLWGMYHKEEYAGVQEDPMVYIIKKPENNGIKVTLQQTAGPYKSFDYEFFKER